MTVHYHDDFGGTGNFVGRVPPIGGVYAGESHFDDLTTIIVDGAGHLPGYTSGSDAGSDLVGVPTGTYTMACTFTPTIVSGSSCYVDIIGRDAATDTWFIESYLHYTDTGGGSFHWLISPWLGDATGTGIYSPADINVDASITASTPAVLTAEITPSGTAWKIDGTTVASTALIPGTKPNNLLFSNFASTPAAAQLVLDDMSFTSSDPISVTIDVPTALLQFSSLAPSWPRPSVATIDVPRGTLVLSGINPTPPAGSLGGGVMMMGGALTPSRVFKPPALILTEDMPLRTSKLLGAFAVDQPLPRRYGDLRASRFKCLKISPTQWFVADHPMKSLTAVQVDGINTKSFEVKTVSSAIGDNYTIVNLAAPAPDGTVVTASGEGLAHGVTGALIENPSDIVVDFSTIARRSDLWWTQLRSEASVNGIALAGSVTTIQSIRSQIDEITDSALAIWCYGMARLYPVTTVSGFVLELDRYQVSALTVSAALQDTADILRLSYAFNDADGKPDGFMEFTASPTRYGNTVDDVTMGWIRTAKLAEATGRRHLARTAGERYDVTFTAQQTDQLRAGTWVKLVSHPQWPFPGNPFVMLTSVTLQAYGSTALCAGETILSYPEIVVTAHSVGIPNIKEPTLSIAEENGIATLTLVDPASGSPIESAFVSLDGAAPKQTDAKGQVTFPVVAGSHKLQIKANGFEDESIEITL